MSTNAETEASQHGHSASGSPNAEEVPAWSKKWTNVLLAVRKPIKKAIVATGHSAATHPKIYVLGVIAFSLLLLITGLFTNYDIVTDGDVLWTPRGSRPIQHGDWIDNESGFPPLPRISFLMVHSDGGNVLGQESIRRAFQAFDTYRGTPGYDDLCALYGTDANGEVMTCPVTSVTRFWNNSAEIFQQEISSDEEAIAALSAKTYPDGTSVDHKAIIGNPEFDDNGTLIVGQSFSTLIELPPEEKPAESFEDKALDATLSLRDSWKGEDGNLFYLEVSADRSFEDEFERAIAADIPLVPIVFVIMSIFTCTVFWKRDWILSRSLLGLGAVVSVLLSLMAGFGLMFICGVAFTSMTQILPFVMFGIGLDDAFIISGAYARTDKRKDSVARVVEALDEVGVSIFVTTLTSVTAFGLGAISSIPAVYWLCYYAIPTLVFDFLFQITFFVALIVIDEKRIKDNRRDCLVCFSLKGRDAEADEASQKPIADKFMRWYAGKLLRPWVKAVVLVSFAGLFGGLAYSASQLEEAFNFKEVLPSDSYLQGFFNSIDDYSTRSGVAPEVFFRFENQADPDVQAQMETYVNDLVAMDQVNDQPTSFWLRDFMDYIASNEELQGLSFREQIGSFLADPTFNKQYAEDIVLTEDGDISSSRTKIFMENVDQEEVSSQTNALKNQRSVSAAQLINAGSSDWSFFTFDQTYYIWEFFSVVGDELLLTAVLGVVAVSVIGMLFIPHWSAVLFIGPMIVVLYVDLMGFLQLVGVSINPVSYISLVMAIGLLVDFLVHIVLRYFESTEKGATACATRDAKTTDTLATMGSSILVGGISTFIGVIPLAFSTSEIFFTVFLAFIGLVSLGITHGLILFPVILSLVGPTVSISPKDELTPERKFADRQATVVSSEQEEDLNEAGDAEEGNAEIDM